MKKGHFMNNCKYLCGLALAGLLVIPPIGHAARQQGSAELQDKIVMEKINPEIQRRLKEFSVSEVTDRKFKSNKEEVVREWAGVDKAELVRQIFLFLRTNRFTDEKEGWRIAGLFNCLGLANGDRVAAILPLLDTSDITLRKMLYGELKSIDERDNGGSHDFSQFSALISQRKNDPPAALLRYMFDRDSKVAVLSMASIYGDKAEEAEIADKLKCDPKIALQSLADRPEWWAHLYVAETMKKNPQLRDPAIIKKLEKDDNSLVQEALAEIKSGQGQSK